MNSTATSLAATILLALVPGLSFGQSFSADVVYLATSNAGAPSTATSSSPHPSSKIYIGKDQIRLETRGLTDTILLVSGEERASFALYPAQKAYQPLASGPSQYFHVENAEDACPDWQKAAGHKLACEKAGQEVVAGRQAVKYRNKGAPDTATAAIWIDLALKFVVKWEDASASAELRNIKEAEQAADLFVVPSDFELLKPQKAKSKGYSKRPE